MQSIFAENHHTMRIALLSMFMLLLAQFAGAASLPAPDELRFGKRELRREMRIERRERADQFIRIVEETSGRRINFFQRMVLRAASNDMTKGGGMSQGLGILLCILLAPLSFLWVGIYTDWDRPWWITLLLELLFLLPGVIYAIITILKN